MTDDLQKHIPVVPANPQNLGELADAGIARQYFQAKGRRVADIFG
jgi:hypothetical protein